MKKEKNTYRGLGKYVGIVAVLVLGIGGNGVWRIGCGEGTTPFRKVIIGTVQMCKVRYCMVKTSFKY
jgi:hypothetical protein